MKGFLQETVINIAALNLTMVLSEGLRIQGGFWSVFTASILITIGFKIVRPIINLITLPLSIITFGLFRALSLSFIVFLITLIYPQMIISPFQFQGFSFLGIIISPFYVPPLLSYVVISVTIYLINKAIFWLFDL